MIIIIIRVKKKGGLWKDKERPGMSEKKKKNSTTELVNWGI